MFSKTEKRPSLQSGRLVWLTSTNHLHKGRVSINRIVVADLPSKTLLGGNGR